MSDNITRKLSRRKKVKPSFKKQNKKLFRSNDPLVSVFIWGVNYSYNELKYIPMPEILMPDDFKSYIKVKIDNQNFNKEILPSHYKVKEYCPMVFKNLRDRFSINDESYLRSILNGLESTDNGGGKSNARFYLSNDKRYLLKTISSDDVGDMHNILTEYHRHVVETKGKTLLPHLLGMYRLTVEDKENYILVMRNIFNSKYKIHTKYDIKGSTVDRSASIKEKEKGTPTFKDNDFLSTGRTLNIGVEGRDEFMRKLTMDVNFLTSLNLMDYSLLIGIHNVERGNQEASERVIDSDNDYLSPSEETDQADTDDDQITLQSQALTPPASPSSRLTYGLFALPSADKKEVYFMALIDILTHYGLKKKGANVAKSVKYPDQEISTVKPEQYAKRFLDFVSKIIKN